MMKGGHAQTSQLHDINWGALDHASHAPYVDMYVCVYEDPLPRDLYHTKHPKTQDFDFIQMYNHYCSGIQYMYIKS